MYVEFPNGLPQSGGNGGGCAAGKVVLTVWERAVASNTTQALPQQPPLAILSTHPVNYTAVALASAEQRAMVDLWVAKVAGFDTAVDGLPASANPLLTRTAAALPLLVATTQLSMFRTHRFAPHQAWVEVVEYIAGFVGLGNLTLAWQPTVSPRYGPTDALPPPPTYQAQALHDGVGWYAAMIPNAQTSLTVAAYKAAGGTAPLLLDAAGMGGSGVLGVFEGLYSSIVQGGRQPVSVNLRDDCITETAMAFAMRSVAARRGLLRDAAPVHGTETALADADERTAINLLDYAWSAGGFAQSWMPGLFDPLGSTLGMLAWSTGTAVSAREYYKDDDARGILAGLALSGLLKTDRYGAVIARAVLGNLRWAGVDGFGPPSGNFADMIKSGWQSTHNASFAGDGSVYSPHYQGYIWCAYLYGYVQSSYRPLYDRAYAAIATMMANYPGKWIPTANGYTMQRARMLLPLAFLVRVNDTALHRSWLQQVYTGLAARQRPCGAFQEEVVAPGWAGSTRVPNNDDYGTFEAPLNQVNTDNVTDLLYTANFAFLGLNEAWHATGNTTYLDALTRLEAFLARAQALSPVHPEVNGAWFRAFDFGGRWEAWGSNADLGWGVWSVESGWTMSWISTVFGLRLTNTSLYDLAMTQNTSQAFADWLPVFFP